MKTPDGPVTAAVREHCRFIMDTAQFLNRLLEPRVVDIIALVSELERQADVLAEQLQEEMSEDEKPAAEHVFARADEILADAIAHGRNTVTFGHPYHLHPFDKICGKT